MDDEDDDVIEVVESTQRTMQPASSVRATQSVAPRARTIAAVVLAGRLRPSRLREAMNVHVLCLPVGRSGTLLESWLSALRDVTDMAQVRVVVNSDEDAAAVRTVLPREHRAAGARPSVEVMAEPASWRGAAGIVRDVTNGLPDDAIILVCEGKRLPPPALEPVLQAVESDAGGVTAGVVGVCGDDMPAGIYAFRRSAMRLVPAVGYCDLKEQLLPAMSKAGDRVVVARLTDEVWRMSDLETYLTTVHRSLNGHDQISTLRVSPRASVSSSAVLDGFCIIEPGAVIEDGAVVHDSVVLWGATVGGGAVISRSIVGPLANVEPRARVIREIVSQKK